jgi:hypothetical protein
MLLLITLGPGDCIYMTTNINLTNRYFESTNITFFVTEKFVNRGTVMGVGDKPNIAVPYGKKSFGMPIGILLVDVVHIDLMKSHLNMSQQVMSGSKVNILTKGEITCKFAKSLRLPYGQPIYVNNSTGELTWKKLGKEVGRLSNAQGKDGWTTVRVDFER